MHINPIVRGDSFYLKISPQTDVQGRSLVAPDWQLKLSFRGAGSSLDVTANSNGEFILAAVDTNKLNVGNVFFQLIAIKVSTSEKMVLDSGSVEVKPNLMAADVNIDLRSDDQKLLDEVKALILNLVKNGGVVEYKIGSRSARKYDLPELRALQTQLETRVRRQQRAEKTKAGLPNPRNSFVRF